MKKIYEEIWRLARPYYEKGRPMDVAHIEWMMKVGSEVCEREKLDDSLLLPLVILHDVGYSRVEEVGSANYYDLDVRRFHMDEGAKIAREILEEVGYTSGKIEQIVEYVRVHDNWAYGEVEIYIDDLTLGTFKDLDYVWLYVKEGYEGVKKSTKKSDGEMMEMLRSEKSPIHGKKPFSNEYTKNLRTFYLKEREADYKKLQESS